MDTTIGAASEDEFSVFYDDYPNPEVAGQGLSFAPFIKGMLQQSELLYWMMAPAEQIALCHLLSNLRPKIGIEIGTRYGGSLQVLARFCEKVYSLDSEPTTRDRVRIKFPNVDFVPGSSVFTLPSVLARLQRNGDEPGFVLVDGDHSYSGVKSDINAVLAIRPKEPMLVVMHDSFIPECRQALRDANWAENPHVRYVELDFVPGTVNPSPAFYGNLCGGLALAYFTPEERSSRFEVTARAEATFQRIIGARQ